MIVFYIIDHLCILQKYFFFNTPDAFVSGDMPVMVAIHCWNANLMCFFNSFWMENVNYPNQLQLQWNIEGQSVFLWTTVWKKMPLVSQNVALGQSFKNYPKQQLNTPQGTLIPSMILLIWLEAKETPIIKFYPKSKK